MGQYVLTKHFWMSCAHSVRGAGKCERVHGHNFKVTFQVAGSVLDEQDMLIDFRAVKHALEKKYDHHLLNTFVEFNVEKGGANPTTEKIAEVFFREIQALCQRKANRPVLNWVEVQETEEAYARYEEA